MLLRTKVLLAICTCDIIATWAIDFGLAANIIISFLLLFATLVVVLLFDSYDEYYKLIHQLYRLEYENAHAVFLENQLYEYNN